jgi:hypothetical protein
MLRSLSMIKDALDGRRRRRRTTQMGFSRTFPQVRMI